MIGKVDKKKLEEIVNSSKNKSEVLKKLGLNISGGNFNTLSRYLKIYDIDISHFIDYNKQIWSYNKENLFKKKNLEDILVENSTFSSNHLKKRLYKEGIKERICELCGQTEIWNGAKMSLILDHINGDHFDNRLENLRILCPNCNATQVTHCRGKRGFEDFVNKNKIKQSRIKSCSCGKIIQGDRCFDCYAISKRTVERPEFSILLKQIEEFGYKGTGRIYGVSDNAIRKWIKLYEKNKGN